MRNATRLGVLATLWGCGGSKPPPRAPEETVEQKKAEDPPPEPAAPAEPAVPKELHAKAALQPVKGAKLVPVTVSFTQTEGQDTSVSSEIEGAKAGKYHFVVHDGSECGPEGTQAGAIWKGSENVKLVVEVGRDRRGSLDETGVKVMLGGVAPITGLVLAMHEDKKGQPGRLVACGTIDAVGGAE
jgi:hypothetical protein